MKVWPAAKWTPRKSTRINYNWDRVVLQEKVMPELKIVAQAQTIYELGMGIPPATRVIKNDLTGTEVVVYASHAIDVEADSDDLALARAIMLTKPERLPERAARLSWNGKDFRDQLNRHANLMAASPTAPVSYWMPLSAIQAAVLRKSGPEAVLQLTQSILLSIYLNP